MVAIETRLKQTEVGAIPQDWETRCLGELVDVRGRIGWRGYAIQDLVEEGPLVIGGTQIVKNKIELSKPVHISESKYDESPEIQVRRLDIILTKTGNSIGDVAIVNSDIGRATINPNVALLRNLDRINPYFLYYWLLSRYSQEYLRSGSSASAQPAINQETLKKMTVPLPTGEEQDSISRILSHLDAKIELNQHMNKALESIGRSIFKHWFLDFEFPNEEGNPYRSSDGEMVRNEELGTEIPKGWGLGTLEDLSVLNPETWSEVTAPEQINYVDLSNTKWGKIEQTEAYLWSDAPSRAQRVLRPGDTIIGTVRPGNGSFSLVAEEGLTGSSGFAVLRAHKRICEEYVYLVSTSKENIQRLSHLADGAAYPAVRPDLVLSTQTLLPLEPLMERFASVIKPIMTKIAHNDKESRTLGALRDCLLPRLVSGKIRVQVEVDRCAEGHT